MSAIKGDFTGFTFNGVHSSELGLTQVSDNSRYTENLYPTIQDKTVQVPGADGTYYFGSYYTQRPINISVAFDDVSEEQLQNIKRVFGDKKIHDLIFDEVPYKVYRVKSTGTPNLKYVCFNKGPDEFDRDYQDTLEYKTKEQLYGVGAASPFGRIYKGEGQLNFICYNPFARSRYKYINDYTVQNIPEWGPMDTASAEHVHYNLYDWLDSVNLKRSDAGEVYDTVTYTIDKVTNSGVMVYNPGNFPVHFTLSFIFGKNENWSLPSFSIGDLNLEVMPYKLTLDTVSKKGSDIGFRINGNLNLIEGIKEDENTIKFILIQNPSGSPVEQGWYEYNSQNDDYELTDDTEIESGKRYYERTVKYIPTGTIYNDKILEGDFFKIPILENLTFLRFSSDALGFSFPKGFIEYDYLYY